jgi:hypothetical protein
VGVLLRWWVLHREVDVTYLLVYLAGIATPFAAFAVYCVVIRETDYDREVRLQQLKRRYDGPPSTWE